jgi:hypothetical protein
MLHLSLTFPYHTFRKSVSQYPPYITSYTKCVKAQAKKVIWSGNLHCFRTSGPRSSAKITVFSPGPIDSSTTGPYSIIHP